MAWPAEIGAALEYRYRHRTRRCRAREIHTTTCSSENPGQGNNWLNVKLIGKKTNRSAIGASIKVVTSGEHPLTVYRQVSSGSKFGANPLEQNIGLGKGDRVE